MLYRSGSARKSAHSTGDHHHRSAHARRRRSRLCLERLEDRTLLDSGLGVIAGLTDTEPNRFVTGLFFDVLHRVPSPSDVVPFVAALANMSREQIGRVFTHSPEYLTSIVIDDYGGLLGREASAGETASWVHALATGMTPDQMKALVLASGEYYTRTGSTASGWVTGIYQDVLARAPDSTGLAAWTAALQSGALSRPAAAAAILASPEALSRVVAADFQVLLGRAPDPTGLAWGIYALGQGGETQLDFIPQITASPEFSLYQSVHVLQGPDAPARASAHFDFGSATSPVASGYTRIPVVPYSAKLGYGWTTVSGVSWFDRGNTDPLTRDGQSGTDSAFLVNMANGTYTVTATMGDQYQSHSNMSIWSQGQLVASGLTSRVKQFLHPNFTAVVTNGTLTLRFTGSTFALNGLDIVPLNPPVANAGPDQSANEGSPVQFSGSVTGGTAPFSYAWDFGDGLTATGSVTPRHVYADNGVYTAALTVTDGQGRTSRDTAVITVANVAPTANANGPYVGTAGSAVSFTATATDSSSADTTAGFTYAWNFGDGSTSTLRTPTHTYANAGVYTVSVTARDKDGATSTAASTTATVVVPGAPPIADAGPDQTVNQATPVSFTGSVAGGNAPFVYSWSFGDGGTETGTLTPTHSYTAAGTYTVVLAVTDILLRQTYATATVTVNEVHPTLNAGGNYSGTVNTAVSFSGAATFPPGVDNTGWTYSWDFGDGSTATGLAPTHSYATAGTYTVRLVAANPDGTTNDSATSATVSQATVGHVTIDGNWLSQHGPAPYILTQANTIYTLATDVTVDGTAFVDGAANVTLDLGGHTVVYGNSAPITVPNGGFEQGTSPADIPGWTFSDPTVASRAPARTGMWGSWMLHLSNISTAQTIMSQSIPIPLAGVEYAAVVTPKGPSGTTATLSVVDAVTGAILVSADSPNVNRGFSPIALFTPANTDAVQLKIVVTPANGSSANVDLDYASLTRSRDYGVVASRSTWYFPAQLQTQAILNAAPSAVNFTVTNGTLIQGTGNGYSSSPVYGVSLNGLTVTGVTMAGSGMDTHQIDAHYAGNVTVLNSHITGHLDRISDRMLLIGGVNLAMAGGVLNVSNNLIDGTMHVGIVVYRQSVDTNPIILDGNTIRHYTLGTDGYGIVVNNANNVEIVGNTIQPLNGRGILFDGFSSGHTDGGLIEGNVVEGREVPNLEYDGTAMEATALRVRNWTSSSIRNLRFIDNVFFAETGAGMDWAAAAMRMTSDNTSGMMTNSGILFQSNVFRARLNSIDPNYMHAYAPRAWAVTMGNIPPNIGVVFRGNTLESNDVSLNFGDNDDYRGTVDNGVIFLDTTFSQLHEGASMPHRSIVLGDWYQTVQNVSILDSQYVNGATSQIYFLGSMPKNISVGYTLNVMVMDTLGALVSGASLVIDDVRGTQVYSGITASDGQSGHIGLVALTYQQSGSDPTQITTVASDPFTFAVALGSNGASGSFNLANDLSLVLTIPA